MDTNANDATPSDKKHDFPLVNFTLKREITELWPLYKYHFRAVCAVRELGRRKYSAFSWQNDPCASNSTVLNNIDALTRHITLCRMGYSQDPEGFPHIFHIACRICMLLTTWSREMQWTIPTIKKINTFPDITTLQQTIARCQLSSEQDISSDAFISYLHITPEEIASCIKFSSIETQNVTVSSCIDTLLAKHQQDVDEYLNVMFDMMHIQLFAILEQYYHLVSLPKEANTSELEVRGNHFINTLNHCDVLQYLSAKLHHFVIQPHPTPNGEELLQSLRRTDKEITLAAKNVRHK